MAQAKRFKVGTNNSKKASKMEFNAEQVRALESFIKKEVSNKMLMDKIKGLTTDIEAIIEKDGWRLESRIEKMIETNDAFIVEEPEMETQPTYQPMPEPDANDVDDPERLM